MKAVLLEDFEDRRRQVRHYLAIVVASERAASREPSSRAQQRRLLTLRAGTFLLLYNLVEASIRGAIDAIHDHITTEQVPFEQLVKCLRIEVVKRFKSDADPSVNHTMASLPAAFVAVALAQGVELSGNVDAKAIRDLGKRYGFSCNSLKDQTWDGADLVTIKSVRNELGHGRKTFEDIGRDYPATELLLINRRSLKYIKTILENISHYLEGEHYKEI